MQQWQYSDFGRNVIWLVVYTVFNIIKLIWFWNIEGFQFQSFITSYIIMQRAYDTGISLDYWYRKEPISQLILICVKIYVSSKRANSAFTHLKIYKVFDMYFCTYCFTKYIFFFRNSLSEIGKENILVRLR